MFRFELTPCPASATPQRAKPGNSFLSPSLEDSEDNFRAQTAGSKPRGRLPFNMLLQKEIKSRKNEIPKPILRTKDTPPSRSRVVIVDSDQKVGRRALTSRNTFSFENLLHGDSRNLTKSRYISVQFPYV